MATRHGANDEITRRHLGGDSNGRDSILKLNRTSHARLNPYKTDRRAIRRVAGEVTSAHRSPSELVGLFEGLLTGFNKRDQRILFLRTFRTLSASSLQELGDSYGVSRERIRQVESTCIKVINSRLKTARFRPLVEASARFAKTIGPAVPISVAEAAGFGVSGEWIRRENLASSMRGFFLWLYGSYKVKDGWMIKQPANQLIGKTKRVTRSLLRRGPASTEKLIEKVCALGISKDAALQWVSTFGRVRVFGPLAIRWEGNLADKTAAILEFRGESMSRTHISELLGPDQNVRTLSNFLSKDERFKRLGPHRFGLSKWGGREYSTITGTIEDVIHANGGEATAPHIISQVHARTGALESSIRRDVYGPKFHRSESGFYRVVPK